jgi:hypothetical protein
MPVDVAVENPRTSIVRFEANGDIVASKTRGHNVALNRINEVVHGATCTANNREGVSMQMDRMLNCNDE